MPPSHWDHVTAWLGQHEGQRVSIELTASEVEGNGYTCAALSTTGVLATNEGAEVAVIDPPPGRHLTGRVDSSFFMLFEGAIEAVDLERGGIYVSTSAGDLAFAPD